MASYDDTGDEMPQTDAFGVYDTKVTYAEKVPTLSFSETTQFASIAISKGEADQLKKVFGDSNKCANFREALVRLSTNAPSSYGSIAPRVPGSYTWSKDEPPLSATLQYPGEDALTPVFLTIYHPASVVQVGISWHTALHLASSLFNCEPACVQKARDGEDFDVDVGAFHDVLTKLPDAVVDSAIWAQRERTRDAQSLLFARS